MILNYLRTGQIIYEPSLNVTGILEEAKFFGIQEMIDGLQHLAEQSNSRNGDNCPLTRQDVIKAITQTSYKSELRFQVRVLSVSSRFITPTLILRVST